MDKQELLAAEDELNARMEMYKAKQTGPPVRIGAYQLSVTIQPSAILARAVLVDESQRDLPSEIRISDKGIILDASGVAFNQYVFIIPLEVTRALLKMAGWSIEYPDSMNPNMKAKEPGQNT